VAPSQIRVIMQPPGSHDDHIGTLTERRDIAKLLRRPLLGWGSRHSNVDHFSRFDIDDEESEQRPKPK
jgi:hypothetical protein